MFDHIKKNKLVKIEFVEIVENYQILHFDEFPILYTGHNKYGNRIIGSHLDEDDESKEMFALHTIISAKEYHNFFNNKISYKNILETSHSTCLIRKDFNFNTFEVYDIKYEEIPKDYLPLENSFFPERIKKYSFNYSLKLSGKLANANKALADEVSRIQNSFAQFLDDRIKSLKGFNLISKPMLEPYSEGSFKINFELDLYKKDGKSDIFIQSAPIDKYISKFVTYIADEFIKDKEIFLNNSDEFSEKLLDLEKSYEELFEKAKINKPDNTKSVLRDDVWNSLTNFNGITEEVGSNFDSIEIVNIHKNIENSLAFIDMNFNKSFRDSVEEIEIQKVGLYEDENFNEYQIHIYHLNADSRTGNAYIKNEDDPTVMSKPRIWINGKEALEETKYTESLHLNKWIYVKAKAKKIGNKYTYLTIDFEL